mmetsp:Transcript_4100/g.9182  ORF Transcript_4100/g.9182 Transcript_4100/m.9182 type:complete len:207 (+) Transcript_4100:4965-5585(+)
MPRFRSWRLVTSLFEPVPCSASRRGLRVVVGLANGSALSWNFTLVLRTMTTFGAVSTSAASSPSRWTCSLGPLAAWRRRTVLTECFAFSTFLTLTVLAASSLLTRAVDTLITVFSAASARSSRYIAVRSKSTIVLRTMKPMLAPRRSSELLQIFGSGVGTSESGPTRLPQIGSPAPLETVTAAPRRDDAPPPASGSMLTPGACCMS